MALSWTSVGVVTERAAGADPGRNGTRLVAVPPKQSVEHGWHKQAMLPAVTELWMEKVGEEEPCDWCGRPGTVRQHEYYDGDELMCRNPSLCDVCVVFWDISGDVGDAFLEAGVDVPATVEDPMEAALIKKWREKVQLGLRSPMAGPAEGRLHIAMVRLPRREDTPPQE